MLIRLIYGILFLSFLSCSDNNSERLRILRNHYCDDYDQLHLPRLKIRYIDNLNSIKNRDSIKVQTEFFSSIQEDLSKINEFKLDDSLLVCYGVLKHEVQMHLERLNLEKRWHDLQVDTFSQNGLHSIPLGKLWYEYFLKKWLSDTVHPDEIYAFGLQEISSVKNDIELLIRDSKMDSVSFYHALNSQEFILKDTQSIKNRIGIAHDFVTSNLSKFFPYSEKLPTLHFKQSTNHRFRLAPAYYNNSTFYYTFFSKELNSRLIDIFYLHEGIPGHHYEISLHKSVREKDPLSKARYYAYIEGWAAYVEDWGENLGVYKDIFSRFGKCEWDIVRAVRICLDIGINYYGWTDERAVEFWKSHIPNQDEIIQREIERIKSQPAQVITYNYGAKVFHELREDSKKKPNYSDLQFHKQILDLGPAPLHTIVRIMSRSQKK